MLQAAGIDRPAPALRQASANGPRHAAASHLEHECGGCARSTCSFCLRFAVTAE